MGERIAPGTRSHLRALNIELLRALRSSQQEHRSLAALEPTGGEGAAAMHRAEQRAEALRRSQHWLDAAIAFTSRPEADA